MVGDTRRKGWYKKGSQAPHDYCYPFRPEENAILRHAIVADPVDAKAPYYLGNLRFEHQPEEAVSLWETSRSLDPHSTSCTATLH